jgi:cysteine desulfurase
MPKSNTILSKNPKNIYLDYASATPIDSRIIFLMMKSFKKDFANPSAIHDTGVKVKKILEDKKGEVASILEAHRDEIIFTSGATESNNLAILGIIALACKNSSSCALPGVPVGTLGDNNFHKLPHIVTTNIEHASVLEVCKYLEKTKQAEVTYVKVEADGIVDSKKIKKALRPNTVLVSVMYANNEIGTIQPIREIAKEIRHYKKIKEGKDVVLETWERDGVSTRNFLAKKYPYSKTTSFPIFHTDATQAINYLPINVLKLGVDLMSFNSAKIYGPKGVGVLYKKRDIKLSPIFFGGDQEFGLRPGTENLPLFVGLAEALKITEKMKEQESKRLVILQNYFFKKLLKAPFDFELNGDKENRLPNNINITIPKIPSDLLVIELGVRGIMASSKSACKGGDGKASHVIAAIRTNAKESEVDGSLRFSLGRQTTKADIDYTVRSLSLILMKLKKWYN